MRVRTRTYRITGCVALALLISTMGQAGGDCSADVQATLARENVEESHTDLRFDIEISTAESCAKIVYDLIVEEQIPNGHAERLRIPREVKLEDGSLQEAVRHRMASGHRMLEYEARIHTCQPCD